MRCGLGTGSLAGGARCSTVQCSAMQFAQRASSADWATKKQRVGALRQWLLGWMLLPVKDETGRKVRLELRKRGDCRAKGLSSCSRFGGWMLVLGGHRQLADTGRATQ
jgi:hypothetical protein